MDRVTAASSMCQLSLHALHTGAATTTAVCNRANAEAEYTKEKGNTKENCCVWCANL